MLKDKGAVYQDVYGWERPYWYARDGVAQEHIHSFRRSALHGLAGAEVSGLRNAAGIADHCLVGEIREGTADQRRDVRHRLCVDSPVVVQTIEMMEAHIDAPLPISQIADEVGVSRRQLERLFGSAGLGSPASYYKSLRLSKARWMLTNTGHSILEIAIACGFSCATTLTCNFKNKFGERPSSVRRRARTPARSTTGGDRQF